jgi:intersectin
LSSGSGSTKIDWAIQGPAKLRYTQLFNTTDRNRSGYLTGTQARNIMVQTKLPQAILAQIWALSDMDSDGRLGCEEFVLAMYLCDMVSNSKNRSCHIIDVPFCFQGLKGEKIPSVLPPELIPPSFRKPTTTSSRHGSIVGGSRHGSVSSQGAPANLVDPDPLAGLPQCKSFVILFITFIIEIVFVLISTHKMNRLLK